MEPGLEGGTRVIVTETRLRAGAQTALAASWRPALARLSGGCALVTA